MKNLLLVFALVSLNVSADIDSAKQETTTKNDKAEFIYLLKQKDSNPSGRNFRLLADAYRHGKGTNRSAQNALLYYVKAAEMKDADAIWLLLELLETKPIIEFSSLLSPDQLSREYWTKILLEIGDSRASISHAIDVISRSTRKEERLEQANIIKKLADEGQPTAMKQLFVMYTQGVVYRADRETALTWSKKWAEAINTPESYFESFKRAMEIEMGAGALDHLQIAADKGNISAIFNLGRALEHGHLGSEVNKEKAFELYKTALENGYQSAYEPYHHLFAIKNSPKLFGVPLYDATRSQLRSALSKTPLTPIRLNWDTFVDIYDPSKVLSGATNLSVVYYPEGKQKLAEMVYIFDSEKDNMKYNKLREDLSAKYGLAVRQKMTKTQMRRQKSSLSRAYSWRVGRVQIILSKTKGKSFKLSYQVHPYIDKMASKIEEYVAQAKKNGRIQGDHL